MTELPRKEQLKQRLLDQVDLQEMFNVTRGTIYNWCKKGIIKFIKIGGKKYFDADDVDALIIDYKQTIVPEQKKKKSKWSGVGISGVLHQDNFVLGAVKKISMEYKLLFA